MIVYKQLLYLTESQRIMLPCDATVLHVDFQDNKLTIWYMFCDGRNVCKYDVYVFGTGQAFNLPEGAKHLATVQLPPYVWHVFGRFTL